MLYSHSLGQKIKGHCNTDHGANEQHRFLKKIFPSIQLAKDFIFEAFKTNEKKCKKKSRNKRYQTDFFCPNVACKVTLKMLTKDQENVIVRG